MGKHPNWGTFGFEEELSRLFDTVEDCAIQAVRVRRFSEHLKDDLRIKLDEALIKIDEAYESIESVLNTIQDSEEETE